MAKAKIEHKAAEAVFFIKFSFPGFSSREAVSKKKASFHKRKDADCAVPPYFPGIQPGHFILNADHGGDQPALQDTFKTFRRWLAPAAISLQVSGFYYFSSSFMRRFKHTAFQKANLKGHFPCNCQLFVYAIRTNPLRIQLHTGFRLYPAQHKMTEDRSTAAALFWLRLKSLDSRSFHFSHKKLLQLFAADFSTAQAEKKIRKSKGMPQINFISQMGWPIMTYRFNEHRNVLIIRSNLLNHFISQLAAFNHLNPPLAKKLLHFRITVIQAAA